MTEETLFDRARQLVGNARVVFLDRECPDPVLRARVEALLAADAASYSPLDGPVDGTRSFGDPEATGSFQRAPTVEEAEGVIIAGRYKLRQQIGEGGMGTVWMADQTEPVKRKVAVKLIRVERGQSKTILARFEAERQAIALMDHPHIAKLLDAGTTDTGAPFFVMELVKGIPLNEFCDQHRLTIPERLNLFTQICSAVQHAHQKGIIHRDLKPTNILVESHDGKPVPKVIDFGLAKATTGLQLTEQSLFTAFGSVMGTPLYMAPEQATFNAIDVDTRADVYALGVILYELLTGTTPISRDTLKKAALDEMLKLIREQEAPTPSSRLNSAESAPSVAASRQIEPAKLGRFVKGELDWIVLKALSKDRDRRYETANGFAKDIERFLNNEAVSACPPTLGYRLSKAYRRNKGALRVVAAFALLLLCGLAGFLYTWQKSAERQAVTERAAIEALDKAMLLRGQAQAASIGDLSKWTEASAAAKQAEGILATGEPNEGLRARVAELLQNLEQETSAATQAAAANDREKKLFARIDAIRIQYVDADELWFEFRGKERHEQVVAADQAYAAAFRAFGVDVDQVDAAEAAKILGRVSRPLELAWALDAWSFNRKYLAIDEKTTRLDPTKAQQAERLSTLAAALDPDPWRGSIRKNCGTYEYRTSLNKPLASGLANILALLENETELARQPARALYTISLMIENSRENEIGKPRTYRQLPVVTALRKRAWQLNPSDFQVCWFLSQECEDKAEKRAFALAAAAAAPQSEFARKASSPSEAVTDYIPLLNQRVYIRKGDNSEKAPEWKFPHLVIESTSGDKVYYGPTRYEALTEEQETKLGNNVDELQWLVRLQPMVSELREELAKSLVRLGRYDEAMTVCNQIMKTGSRQHIAEIIGLELYGMGQLEQARRLVEEAIQKQPVSDMSYDVFHPILGAIRIELGKRDEASKAYERSFLHDGLYENVPVTMFEDKWRLYWECASTPEQVIATYQSIIAGTRPNRDYNYIEVYVLGFYDFGNYKSEAEAAEACRTRAIRKALAWLAEYFVRLGRTDDAIAAYQEALTREDGMKFRYRLSRLLVKAKRPDEAIKIYTDAIAAEPKNIKLHEDLAALYRDMGKQAERLTLLNTIVALRREEVARDGSRLVAKSKLAHILWELGNKDEARKLYRESIAESRYPMGLNIFAMEMAHLLEPSQRDADLAIEAALRACELTNYSIANILDTLATAYAEKGDFASAVKWQLKAVELSHIANERMRFEENLKLFQAGKPLPPPKEMSRAPFSTP